MLDRLVLKLLRPVIDRTARGLAQTGLTADQATLAGFGFGALAAALVATGNSEIAVVPLLVNRALDGLDGALARLSSSTDRGAFLDIGLDFIFYAAIPLAFGYCDPGANALAAATLLAAFLGTGSSFLAFAVIAEKRGLKSTAYPSKSFYYLGGLTEGTETVLCFLAMCIWPAHFASIAYVYAALCAITTVTRLIAGWQSFGGDARS
ncbi:MAG TPA: CDP-alcohol phosphatidyltransferase family protein [Aestuariivirga sp.]|nr:CDP-alcohol phosphatidyltransferase family protein [Aestuariivirga sp.]